MKEKTEQEALFILTALCASGEHCKQEMLDKMRRWRLPEEAQARIMDYLIRERYVDEERYCRAFVKDKLRYSKWGRRKIDQALWQKHVERSIRKKVLDEIDENEYLEVLRPLLEVKRKTLKDASDYEMKGRLIQYAMGRGFTYQQVCQCVEGADEIEVAEEPDEF